MQLSSYGCTQEVAKHERSVRVARGKLHDLHEVKSTINCAKKVHSKIWKSDTSKLGSRQDNSFSGKKTISNCSVNQNIKLTTNEKLWTVKAFLNSWLSLNLDQFSKELQTNCTWLKRLVTELSVLHGLFGKRKEQCGTGDFLKAREESEQTPLALNCLRCSYSIAGLWVTFSSTSF